MTCANIIMNNTKQEELKCSEYCLRTLDLIECHIDDTSDTQCHCCCFCCVNITKSNELWNCDTCYYLNKCNCDICINPEMIENCCAISHTYITKSIIGKCICCPCLACEKSSCVFDLCCGLYMYTGDEAYSTRTNKRLL